MRRTGVLISTANTVAAGAGRGFVCCLLKSTDLTDIFGIYKKILKSSTVPTIQIHCRISFLAVLRSNRLCRHLSGAVLLFDFLSEQQ